MPTEKKLKVEREVLESRSRRKAVKTIASGVTALAAYNLLPVRWEKPIIEQIFLPAHAQTSGVVAELSDPCTITLVSGNQSSSEVIIRVDGFVTPANAGLPVTITATPEGGGNPAQASTKTAADGTFSSNLTINGGPGISRVNVETNVEGTGGAAVCAVDIAAAQSSNDNGGTSEEPPQEEPPQEEPVACGEQGYLVPITDVTSSPIEIVGDIPNPWDKDNSTDITIQVTNNSATDSYYFQIHYYDCSRREFVFPTNRLYRPGDSRTETIRSIDGTGSIWINQVGPTTI